VAPDVEPTHGTSVRDKCAILAPNVGPTSNISILDNFATISLAGVATTRQINDRSGSRDVIGLATQGGSVTVHPPGGRVDNDRAGNVDDSRIVRHPEDVVGRNPRVEPVSADEINGQAVMGLVVQGDALSPSTVAVANVEPVVSTRDSRASMRATATLVNMGNQGVRV